VDEFGGVKWVGNLRWEIVGRWSRFTCARVRAFLARRVPSLFHTSAFPRNAHTCYYFYYFRSLTKAYHAECVVRVSGLISEEG
jgi:hypothetical protein